MDSVYTVVTRQVKDIFSLFSKLKAGEVIQHIRSHDSPRLGIFLGKHEGEEIDLSQDPFGHDAIVALSVIFLVVSTGKRG